MGKRKQKVADYIDNLDAWSMTGNWNPVGQWHDIHGDCKSGTRGKWTMRTMRTSEYKYKVQVLENGNIIKELEYPSEPSFEDVVGHLKAALGS
ncbi:hypothetical protein DV735_g5241, partial [Chaetothyriales sp. CBS 134920]